MSSRTLVASVWTSLMLGLLLMPAVWVVEEEQALPLVAIPHKDKAVHAALFAGFGLFWMRSGRSRKRSGLILATGLALAVGTELAQGLPVVNRDPDVFDALADAVGLVVGIGAFRLCAVTPPGD